MQFSSIVGLWPRKKPEPKPQYHLTAEQWHQMPLDARVDFLADLVLFTKESRFNGVIITVQDDAAHKRFEGSLYYPHLTPLGRGA